MNTFVIDILNPKAFKLLKNLEDLKLISIQEKKPVLFSSLLKKIKAKSNVQLSDDEIIEEVEAVRAKRYENKKK